MANTAPKTKPELENHDVFRVTFDGQNLIWDSRAPLGLGFPFQWALERTERGIRVRRLDGPHDEVSHGAVKEFTFAEVEEHLRIPLAEKDSDWLTLQPVIGGSDHALRENEWAQFQFPAPTPPTAEDPLFVKVLVQVVVGAALLTASLWMLPRPKPNAEELIPPQFAKLLLKPAQKTELSKPKDKGMESTRENNVVRAFQSKTLQSTAKKVLNLGQISGLSKSALVGGLGNAAAAAKVFDAKSNTPAFKGLDSSLIAASGPKLNLGKGGFKNSDTVSIGGQGGHQLALDPSAIEVADGLDKDQVGKTIREHVGEIRYCYETALVRNPALEGKLVVTFVINGNGGVKSATNKQTNADAGLVKCILGHLQKWSFPKPAGGTEVEVSYPFIFKSIGG